MHKQMNWKDRQFIEKHWLRGKKKSWIAKELGVSHTTIAREVDNKRNWDWLNIGTIKFRKIVKIYNAKKVQQNYDNNKRRCGAKYSFAHNPDSLSFIEKWVLRGESPDQAIERARLEGYVVDFTSRTFYNYIEHGISKVTPFDLRFKLRRKIPKHKRIKEYKRKMGKSIDERPENINKRIEFGHWEGDCIVDKNDNAILVCQERSSRYGVLRKLAKHESKEVLEKLKEIREKYPMRSLTVDNGSEFYKITQLEDENFDIYFTHPYSSFEKGSVENFNGLIRRYIPKGTDISALTEETIERIQNQINLMPRKIHKYYNAQEIFTSLTNNDPPVIIKTTNNVIFLKQKMCN